jgi:hypothetical protein
VIAPFPSSQATEFLLAFDVLRGCFLGFEPAASGMKMTIELFGV